MADIAIKKQCNIPLIKKYGIQLLQRYNLESVRKTFTFNFIINHEANPESANNDIIQFIKANFIHDITPEQIANIAIIHKSINQDGLGWHIDDCQIVKQQEPPIRNANQFIHLEGKKYLHFNTPTKTLPTFTILFYSSTYKEDFDGGLLRLADDTEIIPQKQHGILIDSREAHMVLPISRGTRNVSVVKIY